MDKPNYRKTSGGLEQIHHVGLHTSARSSTDFGASKSRHTPGVPGHRPSVIRVVERSGIRGGSYDVTFTRSGQPTSPSSVDPLVSLDVNGVQKFRNPPPPSAGWNTLSVYMSKWGTSESLVTCRAVTVVSVLAVDVTTQFSASVFSGGNERECFFWTLDLTCGLSRSDPR